MQSIFSGPVSADAAPPLPNLQAPLQGYDYPNLKNADGSITRVIWIAPGVYEGTLKPLIESHADGKKVKIAYAKGAMTDVVTSDGTKAWKGATGNDALMLSGPLEAVDAATDLINYILTSVAQIQIETRIVEVIESDEFGLGFQWFFLDTGDHPGAGPGDPLEPSKTLFNRASYLGGIPPLPGFSPGGFIPDVLVELGTIQRDIQVDLLISALKSFTQADVMNAPRVLVLNGHTAAIRAGTEVPYFKLQASGNNTTVNTDFKSVTVELEVVPRLVSRQTLRLVVNTKVDNITGFSTVESAGVAVTNPIISTRGVTTTLDVQDGATVVLGGLITTSKVSVEDEVPLLGSIPIVEFLFSSQHNEDQRSNLIFFIRPKVITPTGDTTSGMILPPEPVEASPDTR